jgi:hypothetical protein
VGFPPHKGDGMFDTNILRKRILVALEQYASHVELVAVLRDAEAQWHELKRL